MSNQRAQRFTLKSTKLTRDAQLSRESKDRVKHFRLNPKTHVHNLQQAQQWADSLLMKENQ